MNSNQCRRFLLLMLQKLLESTMNIKGDCKELVMSLHNGFDRKLCHAVHVKLGFGTGKTKLHGIWNSFACLQVVRILLSCFNLHVRLILETSLMNAFLRVLKGWEVVETSRLCSCWQNSKQRPELHRNRAQYEEKSWTLKLNRWRHLQPPPSDYAGARSICPGIYT